MDNKELQIFSNPEFGEQIRGVEINGVPYVVGLDVAKALGYKNTRDALYKHVDDEDRITVDLNTVAKRDGTSGNPNMTVINESGVWSLALRSKLPSAKKFRRWVTSEVLPSLRKTGFYSMEPISAVEMFNLANQALQEQARKTKVLEEQAADHGSRLTALERELRNPFSTIGTKEWQQDNKLSEHEDRINTLETKFEDKGPAEEIKALIKDAVEKFDMNYQNAYNTLYSWLKENYGINLSMRLSILKKQKEKQNWSATKISKLNMLDAVTANPDTWEKIRDGIKLIRQTWEE